MEFPVYKSDNAPEQSKQVLGEITKAYGFLPNLFGVLAAAPMGPRAYFELNKLFDQTSLTPSEQQVVLMTTSYTNECTYCVAAHTVVSAMKNVPEEIVQAIRDGQLLGDPRMEALRRFTESVVTSKGWPSKEVQADFENAGYTPAQVIEVVLGVAIKTFTNYVNHLANTPLDEAFQSGEWQKPQ